MKAVPERTAQYIAFGIALAFFVAAAALFLHYRAVQNTHVLIPAQVISVEARSTRVNTNDIRRFYHLMVKVQDEAGEQRLLTLKQGESTRRYNTNQMIELIYPIGYIEDIRLLTALDKIWPFLSALAAGLFAFFCGVLFLREARQAANK